MIPTLSRESRLVHFIQGRVRVRIPQLKGNSALAAAIRHQLATLPGVLQVEANPLTGSVLVHYDPQVITQEDLRFLAPWRDLDPDGIPGPAPNHSTAVSGADPPMLIPADPRMLIPLALVTLGIGGMLLVRPVILPKWYEYLWFSFGTYVAFNTPGMANQR